jgi:hypothetical protein
MIQRALGLDPAGVGLLFMVPSVTYVAVSSLSEIFVVRIGARKVHIVTYIHM